MLPGGQWELVPQSSRPEQGVCPSTQKPVPPVMEAHTHEPLGSQGLEVLHDWPVQEFKQQAPLVQEPVGH